MDNPISKEGLKELGIPELADKLDGLNTHLKQNALCQLVMHVFRKEIILFKLWGNTDLPLLKKNDDDFAYFQHILEYSENATRREDFERFIDVFFTDVDGMKSSVLDLYDSFTEQECKEFLEKNF